MTPRNLISICFTALLVFNATCACASMSAIADPSGSEVTMAGTKESGTQAHHHSESEPSAADCLQLDCAQNCGASARTPTDQDTFQPRVFKFDLDLDEMETVESTSPIFRSASGTTGPPPDYPPLADSTPVRRFDLQLK